MSPSELIKQKCRLLDEFEPYGVVVDMAILRRMSGRLKRWEGEGRVCLYNVFVVVVWFGLVCGCHLGATSDILLSLYLCVCV